MSGFTILRPEEQLAKPGSAGRVARAGLAALAERDRSGETESEETIREGVELELESLHVRERELVGYRNAPGTGLCVQPVGKRFA